MKIKNIKRYLTGLFSVTLLVLTLALTGCSLIDDDQSKCVWDAIRIKVVTEAVPGTPRPDDAEVKYIHLYLFNENEKLVDIIEGVSINEVVEIDYPVHKNLYIVALANYDADNENTRSKKTRSLQDGKITLKLSDVVDGKQTYNSPEDLFLGKTTVDNVNRPFEVQEIPIQRIVSSINIKAKGLIEYTKDLLNLSETPTNNDFTFVIKTFYHTVDFSRIPTGNEVYYYTSNSTVQNGIFEVPTFNMFSSVDGEDVTIYIYYKNMLIDTVSEGVTEFGNEPTLKLVANNGKLLQVRISYSGNMKTVVHKVGWWDIEEVWVDEWDE